MELHTIMPAPLEEHRQLLLCSRRRDSTLATQDAVFRHAGYSVTTAEAEKDVQELIEKGRFNILVLNHTLSFPQRRSLAQSAKLHKPESCVLVLHHSGALGNPHVDLAVDSRS